MTLLYEELWVKRDRALRAKRDRIHGGRLVRKANRLHYVLEAHTVNILLFACVLFWLFLMGLYSVYYFALHWPHLDFYVSVFTVSQDCLSCRRWRRMRRK